MKYIHQIVTKENRELTHFETVYSNSSKAKFSFKSILTFKKDCQYEIVNRETKEIIIVK